MTIKILGVDFRSNAVSAVLIRGSYKGIWVDAHAHILLERPEDQEKGLNNCIEILSGQTDLADTVCIAALPSDQFFYRNIASPFTDPRKIDQTLPYELEQSLPIPADDLLIDFIPVNWPAPDKKFIHRLKQFLGMASRASSTRILTAAVERSRMEAYLSCLNRSGLEPERIVPGGYALCLCLMRATSSPANWLLVDADKTHTALFIVFSNALTVIRAFPGAGLSPSVDFLFSLIHQTLLGSCLEMEIDQIFLSGAISNASAVASGLSEKCDLPVHPVNLVVDADIRLKAALPSSWKPEACDPALGAALIKMNGFSGLNLRKGVYGLKHFWAGCRSELLRTGVAVGLAVLAAFAYVRIDTRIQEKQLDFLNRRIGQVLTGTFPEVKAVVEPVHQMRTLVQNAQKQIPGSNQQGQVRLVDLLEKISGRIPENIPVELVRLVYEDRLLQLIGHTDSFNSVEEIKRRLEDPNGGFSLVTIMSANMDTAGSRIQFHLNITI